MLTASKPALTEQERAAHRAALAGLIGEAALRAGNEADPHLREWRGLWQGCCLAVTRPSSTADVGKLVRYCHDHDLQIVPQGGNTGLVGGQIPMHDTAVLICLDRMARIDPVDVLAASVRVEAGATIAAVQHAARQAGLVFPLSIASQGTAQIGGAVATNAGGTGVLAYGSMRSRVLGIEVVLPNGQIWDGTRSLHKDNTGYDLKQVFIGSEGTLGVVTGCVLRLAPAPKDFATVWLSCDSAVAAVDLYRRLADFGGPLLTACELMSAATLDLSLADDPSRPLPLPPGPAWHVLVEFSLFGGLSSEATALAALEPALGDGLALDAAFATSGAQRQAMWELRENLSEVQARMGAQVKHDIALPLSVIPEFLARADLAVERIAPGARPVSFGHLGDGNIHYNVLQPAGDTGGFRSRTEAVSNAVHDIVLEMGGTISAEHGIGRLKRTMMNRVKSDAELDLFSGVKAMFDPGSIMNPDVLLP